MVPVWVLATHFARSLAALTGLACARLLVQLGKDSFCIKLAV